MKFLLDLLAAIFKRPAPAAAPAPEPGPDVPASDQLVRMVADAAERDNIVLTTKAWNGGQIGLEDRITRRERIRQQVGV